MSGEPHNLQERIESLEHTNQFWKAIALSVGGLLLILFLLGAGGASLLVMRAQAARMQALRAEEEARAQRDQAQEVMRAEQAARQEAEAARQQADMEIKKAKEAEQKARKAEKEARDQARRALYQAQVLLAQQAFERELAKPSKGP
jgi:hypothetical protein